MPTVDVRIPGLLAQFTGDDSRVTVEAATVNDAVLAVLDRYPALEVHLLDDRGALRTHLQVFHAGRRVDWSAASEAALDDGDEVVVLQAVSGG